VKLFSVTRETANQDFVRLMELGIADKKGAGRATRYVFHRPE
jgi:Fic family protein